MRTKSATVNLRVEPETKELWESAAEALGKSLTEFVEDCANPEAARVFLRHKKGPKRAAASSG